MKVNFGDKDMELFLNRIPALPDFSGKKTCACVGSSGILLDNEYGELIDSHDIVIRMNDSRIFGYEKHVGTKTDIRVFSGPTFAGTCDMDRFPVGGDPEWVMSGETKDQTFIVKSWNAEEFMVGFIKNGNRNNINFLNPEFTMYCNSMTGNQEATTGFIGIIFATLFFEKVSLFGYSFFQGDWKKAHFYEEITKYKPGHDFLNEKKIVEQFESGGRVKIYK